jgi:large subunit ribosomal protein L18
MKVRNKEEARKRIHRRVAKKVRGTAARPRLAVFRSAKHIYAQVIDDESGKTVASASSREKSVERGSNVAGATEVGKLVASRCSESGVETVVFDRGGFRYHGRVKALANAVREGGLKF